MQCKKKTEMAEAFSLEDLILSVKDRSTAVSGNEAKRARRSGAASSSDSDHLKCHVGLHFDTHTHIYISYFCRYNIQLQTPQERIKDRGK